MGHQSGFSLLELAIVIVILAAILGSVVVPLATQVQARNIKETEELLEDAKEALLGFALSNGRLPCPDTTVPPNGVGDCPPAPGATTVEGFLPWNDLGISPADAWGRLFHYAVTAEFTAVTATPNECPPTGPPALELDLCDNGNIRVDGFGATSIVNQAPAVVVSTGPNGLGGRDFVSGAVLPNPPAGATDETNNLITAPSNQRFILRPYFDDAPAGCVDPACNFDDLVVWLSTPILFNRMVAAGRLP